VEKTTTTHDRGKGWQLGGQIQIYENCGDLGMFEEGRKQEGLQLLEYRLKEMI
jgi:hypothetical protein